MTTLTTTEGRDMATKLDDEALRILRCKVESGFDFPQDHWREIAERTAALARDAALKEAAEVAGKSTFINAVTGHPFGELYGERIADRIRSLIPGEQK